MTIGMRSLVQFGAALSLCLALLFFSPASHALDCGIQSAYGTSSACTSGGTTGSANWTTAFTALTTTGIGQNQGPVAFYDSQENVTWLNPIYNSGLNTPNYTISAATYGATTKTFSFGGLTFGLPFMTDAGGATFKGCGTSATVVGAVYTSGDCGWNVTAQTGAANYAKENQIAYLFQYSLGNNPYYNTSGVANGTSGLVNSGPFAGLQAGTYWYSTAYPAVASTGTGTTGFPTCPSVGGGTGNGACEYTFTFGNGTSSTSGEQYFASTGSTAYALYMVSGNALSLSGSQFVAYSQPAAVPLPASAWLLLSGLGMLGLVLRQSKIRALAGNPG